VKRLFVIGSSGHAGSVLEAIELQGEYQVLGLLDSFEPVGTRKHRYEVYGPPEDAVKLAAAFDCRSFFIAIGDNWSRWRISRCLEEAVPGFDFPVVCHPGAVVSRSAKIGRGTAVLAAAVVGTDTMIGEGCIVNVAAAIGHDCRMENYSSIAGGVRMAGGAVIGERSTAGVSSTLLEKITVGRDSVVAAGAVLFKNVPDEVVVFGNPARIVRTRKPDEPYMR
jgi:sugar O-acyltransferase (sialic acid O-acetyltransferase NeuD family)